LFRVSNTSHRFCILFRQICVDCISREVARLSTVFFLVSVDFYILLPCFVSLRPRCFAPQNPVVASTFPVSLLLHLAPCLFPIFLFPPPYPNAGGLASPISAERIIRAFRVLSTSSSDSLYRPFSRVHRIDSLCLCPLETNGDSR